MNAVKKVYLAGPITGLSYGDARLGWRQEIARLFEPFPHISTYSPMRAKEFLQHTREIKGTADSYGDAVFGQGAGILTRDHNDVFTCDAMIANFLGAKKGSLGTAVEFGWANAYRKPVVMIIEKTDDPAFAENAHNHLFMHQIAGYTVHDLETAVEVVASLLTKGI